MYVWFKDKPTKVGGPVRGYSDKGGEVEQFQDM